LLLPEDDVPAPAEPPPATGLGARLLAAFRDLARPASSARAAAPAASGKRDFIRLSPTVQLGARERISALLVLSGKPAKDQERIEQPEGKILRGKIDKEKPRTGPIPVSRKALILLAVPVALIGLIIGQLVSQPPLSAVAAKSCVGGHLSLIGSTAFAPAAHTIAAAYQKSCPTASITVTPDSNGSVFGLTTLVGDGQQKHARGVIAMSDGPAPTDPTYRPLRGTPIAIIIFTVAVNKGVGLRNLTAEDVRKMFDGQITTWSQLGGPDIPVRLISREFGSGSRRAFDADVLDGTEPGPTSFDCRTKPPSAPITLCTVQQTGGELADVGTIPGALGYAQTGDVAAHQGGGVQPVALDGLSPTFGDIGRSAGQYPFWTVEYLYTYGHATGLAAAFLKYLGTAAAVSDLTAADYTPCPASRSGRAGALCAQAGS
jgi:phosphate transport system substrate-binding protein